MLRGWMQRLREEWGDQRQRILLLAAAVLTLNLLSAVAHMALGVWMHSAWYLVLAAYYALLGVMRYGAVRFARKRKECRAEDECFVMRFCGWCLTALTLILAQTITISLAFDRIAVHHEIVMISLATYTFYKLTLAIINVSRSRKLHSPLLRTIRNIACADAAASIVSLQRSMIASFGGMEEHAALLMNALTGGAACLFMLLLGLNMIFDEKGTERMAKSKLVQANRKLAEKVSEGFGKMTETVVDGYKKVENGVVGGYRKIEDKFVDQYLTREGESVEECKERLKRDAEERSKKPQA